MTLSFDPDDGGMAPPSRPAASRHALGLLLAGLGLAAWGTAAAVRWSSATPAAAPVAAAGPRTGPRVPVMTAPALVVQGSPAPPDPTPPDPPASIEALAPDVSTVPQLAPVVHAAPPAEPEPALDGELRPPEVVRYTIRHGGSLENVANLFKIFHHEIIALNPGLDLDLELPPKSTVVVYRREPGERSESVGLPSAGTLEGGVPMLAGPGRILKMIPWKGWGTAHTVTVLDRVLRRWDLRDTDQPILVGNMSSRHGGELRPHSTHQSGRDVDLGYPQRLAPGAELGWADMTADNLDAAQTWDLLSLLRDTGDVECVYIDRSIQALLWEQADRTKRWSTAERRRWKRLIEHVPGHTDHLHVRFRCQPHEKRCRSADPG